MANSCQRADCRNCRRQCANGHHGFARSRKGIAGSSWQVAKPARVLGSFATTEFATSALAEVSAAELEFSLTQDAEAAGVLALYQNDLRLCAGFWMIATHERNPPKRL